MPEETLLSQTRQRLKTAGLQARKGLGQHFLIDKGAVQVILTTAGLNKTDTVIEVGPGLGVMTDELARLAGRVIAVELDMQLARILKERFAGNLHVEIINADILKTDPATLAGGRSYKVVANLPYYITSAVIRHFLEASIKPDRLVLMTQKEVAAEITAVPGEMSLLAVSVQIYGKPELVEIVPAASFYPAPRVDSAIIKIDTYPAAGVGIEDIREFFTLVKAGFSANRKQIVNPLAHRLAMPREDVLTLLEKAGIDYHRRAETLTIEEWKRLYEIFTEESNMITIEAPAKINLTLEITGKRPDGYHELKSVVQTVNLCDTITFSDNDNVVYAANSSDWYAEKSLVSKAVTLLTRRTGYDGGAEIHVEKRIPVSAGLGGDSSDAAAVLLGLNRHWKLRFTKRDLAEMAAELGSDVPFFIYGGTCLMEGRGEKITPLPAILHRWMLLVIPRVPQTADKTKNAYARIKPDHYTDGAITRKMVADIGAPAEFDHSTLFNTFENVSFAPGGELLTYRDHLLKIGAPHVHLAGSGPALYTLLDSRQQADDLFARLSSQDMEVFLTETRPESLE